MNPNKDTPKNPNVISSDDTDLVRQQKLNFAAQKEREAREAEAEEKREADRKAAAEAEKEKLKKPTEANPQVSAGSEPPAEKASPTSHRPHELVKAGQSGNKARSTKLSRQQMEDVIKAGGSVMHNGVIHTQVGSLPAEADLVQGDEEAEKRVAAELVRQRDAIDAQLSKLRK